MGSTHDNQLGSHLNARKPANDYNTALTKLQRLLTGARHGWQRLTAFHAIAASPQWTGDARRRHRYRVELAGQ